MDLLKLYRHLYILIKILNHIITESRFLCAEGISSVDISKEAVGN